MEAGERAEAARGSSWLGRIDGLIPAGLLADSEARLRSRVLVWCSLGLGVLGTMLVVVRAVTTPFDGAPLVSGAMVLLVLSLPWVQRRTESHQIPGAMLVLSLLVALVLLHVLPWAFPGPPLVLFPVVPLFGTFFVGVRFGLFGAVAAAVLAVGLKLMLAPLDGPQSASLQWSFVAVGAVVPMMSWLLTAGYERARAQGEAELADTNIALEDARARAEAASRSKSEFLRHVSHELRTPLNAIVGYGELLEEELADAGQDRLQGDVEKIRGASQHLLALINDLLDISRIEAGALDLALAEVPLGPLVMEVRETALPLAAANHNTLLAVVADDVPVVVSDARRLRQVLLNLASNACKFTERGRVVLEAAADGEGAVLRVRDTGVGMTAEQVARLFEPFVQVHASEAARRKGTGLGLALSRRLMESLGGSISVESEPGRGTTFVVRVPRRARAPVALVIESA